MGPAHADKKFRERIHAGSELKNNRWAEVFVPVGNFAYIQEYPREQENRFALAEQDKFAAVLLPHDKPDIQPEEIPKIIATSSAGEHVGNQVRSIFL